MHNIISFIFYLFFQLRILFRYNWLSNWIIRYTSDNFIRSHINLVLLKLLAPPVHY
ncbi:hypothetical protein KSF78_0003477 [Schistosoma japonicum]|nr:hypothetical protein KSF78_0003477 [Schistosoma japonicum]